MIAELQTPARAKMGLPPPYFKCLTSKITKMSREIIYIGVRFVPQGVNTVSDLTVGTINSVPDTVDAFVDFGTQSGNKHR